MPRVAAPLVVLALLAAGAVGCGSSGGESTREATSPAHGSSAPDGASAKVCDAYSADGGSLRATAISCEQARQVMHGWQRRRSCATPADASRGSCLARSYRCLSTRTDRGIAVSCARAGRSIAFVVRRR